MKTPLIFCLIIIGILSLTTAPVIAQDAIESTEIEVRDHHQFGFNVTGLAKQFLSFNNNTVFEQSPYLLTYNYHFKKDVSWRFAIGGFYNSTTIDNQDVFIPRTNNDFAISSRVGLQFDKHISKRWSLHYGIDLIFDYSRTVVKTQSTSFGDAFEKTFITQGGLGPVLGFGYQLHPKVKLWTEASLYGYYRQLSETDVFEGTEFEYTNYVYEIDASLQMPISVFLSLTF